MRDSNIVSCIIECQWAVLAGGAVIAGGMAADMSMPSLVGLLAIWFLIGVGSSLVQTPGGRLLRRAEAPAPAVDAEQGAGVGRRHCARGTREAVQVQLEASGRHVPTIVDQVVSFTIATDDVMVTVPPPLAW
jgi:hypothetical protein